MIDDIVAEQRLEAPGAAAASLTLVPMPSVEATSTGARMRVSPAASKTPPKAPRPGQHFRPVG